MGKGRFFINLILFIAYLTSAGDVHSQCNALFTFEDTDLTIQFIDQSTSATGDPIVSWFWDFDDGSTSTQQNPLHTFPEEDKYDVVLEITTQSGCVSELEIRIEICVLNTTVDIGTTCDGSGNIEIDITVSDVYDNADEIDILIDGQVIPGGPYPIDASTPVMISIDIPGDGLSHTLVVQSTDIGTCNASVDFTAVDCNSNCFLSAIDIQYDGGTTHIINVDDNFFDPVSTNIVIGDGIVFQWVGGGQHSSTSDATAGPDSWNSGEIGSGSTFNLDITNPGLHRYYCIPHGGPNGSGMAGTIVANCPSGNSVDLIVAFNTSVANPAGVNLYIDNVLYAGSPFAYAGVGANSISFSLSGDGGIHNIMLEDVNDATCTLSTDYLAPDCGAAPMCSLSATATQTGGCTGTIVPFEVTVMDVNGGSSGFNVLVDGATTASSPYTYDASGTTVISENILGDGGNHSITIQDIMEANCNTQINVTTPNCALPCAMSGLTLSTGNPVLHQVEVLDFDFSPTNITVSVGDTVEFFWTGQVDHTTTSDATSGPDSWNSGLLGAGATYRVIVETAGVHLYYCEPHGGPGSNGMSGSITALAGCTNGLVQVAASFDVSNGGFSGYNMLVDGVVDPAGPFAYASTGPTTGITSVNGDGGSHDITIQDVDNTTCQITNAIITPDCNASVCQLTVSAAQNGGCMGADVPVDITVMDVGGGPAGFNLFIDGMLISGSPFAYQGSGTTVITQNVVGDGASHLIEITDVMDVTCGDTASITTQDCTAPCSMSGLTLSTGNPVLHQVEVLDFDFSPTNITVSVGDTVEFFWTGQVDHTTTSDATSGPDSWNSGLLGAGATYRVIVETAGIHLYYCEPHGGPGSNGMSGSITALAGCTNGLVQVAASFDASNGGFSGYNMLVDGVVDPAGPFAYASTGPTTGITSVNGDGGSHNITIQDVDNTTCQITNTIITPDCNASVCQLTVSAAQNGGCTGGNVPVDITVMDVGGGPAGFNLFIDGMLISGSPFAYQGSGTTVITQNVVGDGASHLIEITDVMDVTCGASTSITTQDCTAPCSMSGLTLSTGNPVLHQVEVLDFDFSPTNIIISVGDTVEFYWTGQVAHTTTSDAISGPDSWNSGLLGAGATYRVIVETAGVHLYYCEPHGGPGSNGMSGSITALAGCTNGLVQVAANFDVANGGFSGYNILVDGVVDPAGPFAYASTGSTTGITSVVGDGGSHDITMQDVDNATCQITNPIITPDCNASVCQLSVSAAQNGGCTGGDVPVDITVVDVGGGPAGFNLFIDGMLISGSPFAYQASGTTVITQNVIGDGLDHLIAVEDVTDGTCGASVSITTQNCTAPCLLSDLNISTGNPVAHIVEVQDFVFVPEDITVNVGDTILFDWTGSIPHTSTSDATSGPMSWNSDLLSQGDQFVLVVTGEGFHQYYCEPHGNPGGIGMSGSIHALANCDQGSIYANVSFIAQNNGPSGYNLFVDNVLDAGSPYTYMASNPQQVSVSLPGDGSFHTMRIADAVESGCQISDSIQTTNCDQGNLCSMVLIDTTISGCNNILRTVTIDFSILNPGSMGYEILVNQIPFLDSVYQYESGNDQSVEIQLNGSGSLVEVVVQDIESPTCQLNFDLDLPLCGEVCQIVNLMVQDGPERHVVSVADYEFIPSTLNISRGDTIDFVWTGQIPHTSTSDASSGADTWNSGLLGQGENFVVLLEHAGVHQYYCEPHGGPNLIGMSGAIIVEEACQGDTAHLQVSFEATNGSSLGYEVFIDGHVVAGGPFPYDDPTGSNTHELVLLGDGANHVLTIQDLNVSFCAASVAFEAPLCGAGCAILDFQANVGSDIKHEVEVRDFDFYPADITVTAGETVEFLWTGFVPHTTTSDALSGSDSWNSGLLGQGASFEVSLLSTGPHPYYCEPHGGPNQIGMAGSIEAIQACIDNMVRVQLDFVVTNGSALGYRVFLDGNLVQVDPFLYENQMGRNRIMLNFVADGSAHIITVQDMENPICAASTFVDFPTCGEACAMENLSIDFTTPALRLVEVRDFEFVPRDIIVEAGDIIRFNWTGDIPHTVTSSATTGDAVFNSGLLGNAAQWELQLTELGSHGYFCIPHGTAAGTGMAGTITVVDRCENDSLNSTVSFSAVNGNLLGYKVFVDDLEIGEPFYPYLSSGENQVNLNLQGDGISHEVIIQDIQDTTCRLMKTLVFPDCNDTCYNTTAAFSFIIDESSQTVIFQDGSSSNVNSWNWDFDDGSTSSQDSPTHSYDSIGTYDVCLTVFDSTTNCSSQYCDKITLGAYRCQASFAFAQDGMSFDFVNTSQTSDTIDRYSWSFGDGMSSDLQNPNHLFLNLGAYEVCLTIQADSCSSTYCETLDLTNPCLLFSPAFEVQLDPDQFSVVLTDQTGGNPDSWLWGFGDGNTSTDQNPEHTYAGPGLYTVCLLISNSSTGCFGNVCEVVDLRASAVRDLGVDLVKLNVYPNPSASGSQSWMIQGLKATDYGDKLSARIYDFSGAAMDHFDVVGSSVMNAQTRLNAGVYIMRMQSSTKVYYAKLLVL